MDFIKEIIRRLTIFAIIVVGSLGIGKMAEIILVRNGFPELYGELVNMVAFVFLILFSFRELKFEEMR